MGYIKPFILVILFSFLACYSFAQQKKYDSLWKKADKLSTSKGLNSSALKEVKKIYALAKKENNEAQLIKALIYQTNLETLFKENAILKAIYDLEAELKTTKEPALSILNSIIAESYWNYFQQRRWQLYGRTETAIINEDAETWTIGQFHKRISERYQASVKNEKILQQTRLDRFDPILIKGNARALRPTLFDLLAHRAIGYFRNEERDVTRPAYAFYINDTAAFAEAGKFINYHFETTDTLSLQHKALTLFQRLLRFHENDANPAALIDADINRIQFVFQYGQMDHKDSLYLQALENITRKFPDYKIAGQAYYLIAQWHANLAIKYEPLKDTIHRYEYLKAKRIVEEIIEHNKENQTAYDALRLLEQIKGQHLELVTEKVNIPGKPFRTLVNFRNIDQINLKLVQLTDALKSQLKERYDDSYWQQLINLKSIRSWSQELPVADDFQQHAVEIKIDPLPACNYLLLATAGEDARRKGQPVAAQYFYVSNISFVSNRSDYFALHRETGKPLVNAVIQVWNVQYDYNTRKNTLRAAEKLTADEHGYFNIQERKRTEANIRLELTHNSDRLFQDDYQYGLLRESGSNPNAVKDANAYEKVNARVFFFTDRSIYRSGQKIYFKGIAVTKDYKTKKNKILSDYSTRVHLFNANGELVDSLMLTTNEFGSYSGHFQLPENLLNGSFRLQDIQLNSETYFSVEEYKRPKFYVEYATLKDSYKLNDSISVSGSAKSYAGNNINGATVSYSVIREARFPYFWRVRKSLFVRNNRLEITNGVVTTDEEGRFTITFKAIPDRSIDTAMEPVFDYKLIANITDINGETRTGEKIIPVSYKSLQIQIDLPSESAILTDSLRKLTVTTTNTNGQFLNAKVKLQVSRLLPPERLLRSRLWPEPDMFVIDKATYLTLFPTDEYHKETDVHSWAIMEEVFQLEDSTRLHQPFSINTSKFQEGWYLIEAVAKDKYGQEVKDQKYVHLYKQGNKSLPEITYSWFAQQPGTIQPGEKSIIEIASAAADVFIIQHIDRKTQADPYLSPEETQPKPEYQFLTLNKERKQFEFPAGENDRGGFGVTHFFVKDNRFHAITNIIHVPWSDKELAIAFESFRDKTLPGSEEKWKLKISGLKKEIVAAELLASMYDASLDQFYPHAWNRPEIWPLYFNHFPWNSQASFSTVNSEMKPSSTGEFKPYYKIYDRLLSTSANSNNQVFRPQMRESFAETDGKIAAVSTLSNRIDPDGNKSLLEMKREGLQDAPNIGGEVALPISQNSFIPPIQSRTNFNETAFFIPDLKSDADGNIEFSFTMPEALTRWKFQALAHTKQLAFALSSKDVITQKDLMVQPNAPRFLREGDRMELSTKVVNLTGKEITGTVQLELFNATTIAPIDGWFQNAMPNQFFTAAAGQSVVANFRIEVPYQFNSAVIYRFTARSPQGGGEGLAISDGEEAALPVLTNSMLVTETMPLTLNGNQAKQFSFSKLIAAGESENLKHQALTLEFTSNPAWYAVQALPYLAEPVHQSADHLFNRFYANALAFKIANSSPRIMQIFERWKTADTTALLSNLQKNQELKSILLQETPWVLQAKSEAQQKKNIALLFDMVRMGVELTASIAQVKEMQSPNGGFMWFKGGPDDRYITQYILTSIGHLKKLDALPASTLAAVNQITVSGLKYLDERIREDYNKLQKLKKTDQDKNQLSHIELQYLYMRSFFPEYGIPGSALNAVNYFRKQSQQYWLQQSRYMQGMIALSLFRTGDKIKALQILRSLKENSLYSEEMGRYWKDNSPGYFWYQSPVVTHSLLIETFSEIGQDTKLVNELKTWLLKQKQTQNWKTGKATADACYALLISSDFRTNTASGWLNNTPQVEIVIGNKTIRSTEQKEEAGTGYFKTTIDGPFINPLMGNITVKINSATPDAASMPTWGAVYWQYFERLDKITAASSPLQIEKKLFIEKNSGRGPVLQPISEGQSLKKGDKIKVRIVLKVDRNMEYVHMKDMRASSMEPVNVISGYKWQGGLGYYESTKDASTSFFFNWLTKGTYIFEYPTFVTQTGNFSNGITSVQSMYAPEFTSHSEGIRISVE